MSEELQGPLTRSLKKDDVLCRAGDKDSDLYKIHKGQLIVCLTKGTQVIPIAFLNAGEYFGELSFFDQKPRSAHVIATEDTTLIQIPILELKKHMPKWLLTMAKSITAKIRITDQIIREKGLSKRQTIHMKPLSIEEQRHYYSLINLQE